MTKNDMFSSEGFAEYLAKLSDEGVIMDTLPDLSPADNAVPIPYPVKQARADFAEWRDAALIATVRETMANTLFRNTPPGAGIWDDLDGAAAAILADLKKSGGVV